jgi:hypothetical protein
MTTIQYPICLNKLELEDMIKADLELDQEHLPCVSCTGRLESSAQTRLCTNYKPTGQGKVREEVR